MYTSNPKVAEEKKANDAQSHRVTNETLIIGANVRPD